jgi:hypothetical protein
MRALRLAAAAVGLAVSPGLAQETRWTVDGIRSLAWWQINPHMNHLWATTCPREPSWRQGEDRESGPGSPRTGYAAILDTVRVPLYPRKWALPLCAEAVRGEIATTDTVTWRDARGLIVLDAGQLTIGQPIRDEYARKTIYTVVNYPDIRFQVDSLTGVIPGDTLEATVLGTFEFRGVRRPTTARARAWREAGGLRVLARVDLDIAELTDRFGLSKLAMGLGIGGEIWKYLHFGVDVVLKKAG